MFSRSGLGWVFVGDPPRTRPPGRCADPQRCPHSISPDRDYRTAQGTVPYLRTGRTTGIINISCLGSIRLNPAGIVRQ